MAPGVFKNGIQHLLFLALLTTGFVQADDANETTPISHFYSRPDLQPPSMTVTLQPGPEVEPGYVFLTPYQEMQAGPYIFDKYGNLIWSGFGSAGPWNAHNLHPCQYAGTTHLCVFQGNQQDGYARGHDVILNTNYEIVQTIESGGMLGPADQHEFRLAQNDETALITVYDQKAYDLSRLGITKNQGWILDGHFQEVNISSGKVLFSWSALENVDPFQSYVGLKSSDISGDGLTPITAWDFFHINSIDKSVMTGNYIISARHMSTIYNINATDGSIIWQLQAGGTSDFACLDFNFSFQHDAQIQQENKTHMTISIFDNASNNANKTSDISTGKIISIDYEKKTASLAAPETFYPSDPPLLSASQGNTQILANGNIFHGWGSWPYMSEHSPDAKAIWTAQIGPYQGMVMSYRAITGNWSAIPNNSFPAIFAFSKNSDSSCAFYVSWNGCTEVDSWNFYVANAENDPLKKIGSTKKLGFETMYVSDTHYGYALVEAVDANGNALSNSSFVQTFVPSAALAASCGDNSCPYHGFEPGTEDVTEIE